MTPLSLLFFLNIVKHSAILIRPSGFQASVAQRPSMADVVKMLTEEDCEITEPKQPSFKVTSNLSASTTRLSYCNDSFMSNPVTLPETSYPSNRIIQHSEL